VTGPIAPPVRRRRLKRPGRLGVALLVIAVAIVLGIATYGTYEFVQSLAPGGEPTLVVYTYPSLFGGTDCGAPAFSTVFGAFESAHRVRIEVECPAGTLLSTLLDQRGSAGADLVIGLDELTAPVAEADHLLIPYRPAGLANVPMSLVDELSPEYAAVPYEYGYLAIDYNATFAASTGGAIANSSFVNFTSNATWAKGLLTENPEFDITGEEFLAWQVEFYETVLHQNWTGFWRSAWSEGLPTPALDWGTAFGEFSQSSGNPPMVVSYSTDPAYAAAYGEAGAFNSTVARWNGIDYGWRTIYGIGIVNGSRQLPLDEEFENWFLNGTVQSEIPENEWEYPANTTTPLPSVFDAAIDPATIVPLNDAVTPAEVAAALPGWISEWVSLEPGPS
jgi:ABC transporter substrate-binding protein (ThiB subfamily)